MCCCAALCLAGEVLEPGCPIEVGVLVLNNLDKPYVSSEEHYVVVAHLRGGFAQVRLRATGMVA